MPALDQLNPPTLYVFKSWVNAEVRAALADQFQGAVVPPTQPPAPAPLPVPVTVPVPPPAPLITFVTVISPFNGDTVPAGALTVRATAASTNGIHGWEIYADNLTVFKLDNDQNTLTATIALPAPGVYSLRVRAWDKVAGFGTSSVVKVTAT